MNRRTFIAITASSAAMLPADAFGAPTTKSPALFAVEIDSRHTMGTMGVELVLQPGRSCLLLGSRAPTRVFNLATIVDGPGRVMVSDLIDMTVDAIGLPPQDPFYGSLIVQPGEPLGIELDVVSGERESVGITFSFACLRDPCPMAPDWSEWPTPRVAFGIIPPYRLPPGREGAE